MSSVPAPAPPPPPPPSSAPKSVIPSSNKALLASIQKGTSLKKVPDSIKNDRSEALVSTTSSNSTPILPSNTSNNDRGRPAAPVSMGGMDLQSQLQQKLRGLANNNNINVKPINTVPVSNNKPMNNVNSMTARPINTNNNNIMNKPTNPRPMMGPAPVTNNNSQPTVGQFLNNRYKSPPNAPPSCQPQPQMATVVDHNNNTNKAINNWKSNTNRAPAANQFTAAQSNINKAPPPPPSNKKPLQAFGSSAAPSIPKQKVPAPPPPYAKRTVREPQQSQYKSAPAPPAPYAPPNQRPISAQYNSYSSSVNRVTPNPPPPVSTTSSSSSSSAISNRTPSSGHINNQRQARPQSNIVSAPYNNPRHSITSIQNKPAPPPPPPAQQRYSSTNTAMHQRPAPAAPISPARSASITSIKQSPPPPPPNISYTNQINHPPPPPVPMRVAPGIPITNGNYSYNRVMDRAPPPPPPSNQPKFDSKFRFPLESQFPTVARIDQSLCSNINSSMNHNYY